ncbi:MAG: ATP phosphoribosyltransferase regulatory subunit, partial [Clostridiales bacterium]
PYFEELCPLCQQRLERNPLRIMDCKNEHCQAIIADAPKIREYLCDDCREHFAEVQELLVAAEIPFVLDDNLVRGLDYYTRTAFEIVSGKLGSQSAVCGGGRYDGLMKDIGGPAIPGVGFALGLERLISLVEQENPHWYKENKTEVFISVQNQELNTKKTAFALCCLLRKLGWSTEMDLLARSLKSQFKQADKIKADYVLLIGGDELAENKAVLRKMSLGEQEIIPLEEVAAYFEKLK